MIDLIMDILGDKEMGFFSSFEEEKLEKRKEEVC